MKNYANEMTPGDVFHPGEIVKDEMEAARVAGIRQIADEIPLGGAARHDAIDCRTGRGQHLERMHAGKDEIFRPRTCQLVNIARHVELRHCFFKGQPIIRANRLRLLCPVG